MTETRAMPSLDGVTRSIAVLGTLGALAHLAYDLVSIAFQLGLRIGIRSAVALIVPIFAGSYVFVAHRDFLRRIRRLPAALRFSAALVAGTLAMASIRFFLVLYPLPIAELVIASCIAVLAFTSGSPPGSSRPLAPYGLAAGMLLYLVCFGVPRIVPG